MRISIISKNTTFSKEIENMTHRSLAGVKLSEGTCLNKKISEEQTEQADNKISKQPRYDVLELKETGENQKTLAPSKIVIKSLPEFRNVAYEEAISFDNMLQNALNTVNRKKLSYGERMSFLRNSLKNWVNDKWQNDEEMFASYLKGAKFNIEAGRPEVEGLPSDFTMEDYHHYVDKWENIWQQQEKARKEFW